MYVGVCSKVCICVYLIAGCPQLHPFNVRDTGVGAVTTMILRFYYNHAEYFIHKMGKGIYPWLTIGMVSTMTYIVQLHVGVL